jgi:hypothetical protein
MLRPHSVVATPAAAADQDIGGYGLGVNGEGGSVRPDCVAWALQEPVMRIPIRTRIVARSTDLDAVPLGCLFQGVNDEVPGNGSCDDLRMAAAQPPLPARMIEDTCRPSQRATQELTAAHGAPFRVGHRGPARRVRMPENANLPKRDSVGRDRRERRPRGARLGWRGGDLIIAQTFDCSLDQRVR